MIFEVIETVYSKNNKPVNLLISNNTNYNKTILIIGVFHGDEIKGEFLINNFIKTCKDNPKNRILCIPCLNPDGKELKTRQNANGVDLNRNFPTNNWCKSSDKNYYGGNTPASEIETKFLIKVLNHYKIDMILSLHEPYKIVNYDGNAYEYAKKISQITGYPIEEDIGYPTPGSFGTYAGIEKNIPVITLELPDNENETDLWNKNKNIFIYLSNEI